MISINIDEHVLLEIISALEHNNMTYLAAKIRSYISRSYQNEIIPRVLCWHAGKKCMCACHLPENEYNQFHGIEKCCTTCEKCSFNEK